MKEGQKRIRVLREEMAWIVEGMRNLFGNYRTTEDRVRHIIQAGIWLDTIQEEIEEIQKKTNEIPPR